MIHFKINLVDQFKKWKHFVNKADDRCHDSLLLARHLISPFASDQDLQIRMLYYCIVYYNKG